MSLWLAESRLRLTSFKSVMEAAPVSSFLFALNKADPSVSMLVAQGFIMACLLAAAGGGAVQRLKSSATRGRERVGVGSEGQ